MSVTDPTELKRHLRAAGFEIYRTVENQVQLAERVRDNLIMDSGVAAVLAENPGYQVEVTVRAQASHFPGASADQIWTHARGLAEEFLADGYEEAQSRSEPVPDPSDPTQSLDMAHEITLRRTVESVDGLCAQLRAALERRRSTNDD